MANTTQYQIIARDDDQAAFVAEVNAALELGWELHGSTQVAATTNNLSRKISYLQAMTRPAPPAAKKAEAAPKAKPAKAKAKGKSSETAAASEAKAEAAEPPADAEAKA